MTLERLHNPWFEPDHWRAGMLGLRGSVGEEAGLFANAAKEIADLLRQEGVFDMPIGVDVCEPPMLFALQQEGRVCACVCARACARKC